MAGYQRIQAVHPSPQLRFHPGEQSDLLSVIPEDTMLTTYLILVPVVTHLESFIKSSIRWRLSQAQQS